jgi:hypothetical protein
MVFSVFKLVTPSFYSLIFLNKFMRPDPDPPPPVLPSRRSKLIAEPPAAEAKKEFVLRIPAPVLKQTKERGKNPPFCVGMLLYTTHT